MIKTTTVKHTNKPQNTNKQKLQKKPHKKTPQSLKRYKTLNLKKPKEMAKIVRVRNVI